MSEPKVKIDALNKHLLLELMVNCRQSYRQLGNRLGVSYKTIQKRMKKLITSKVIVAFTINSAPAVFGEEDLMILIYPNASVKESHLLDNIGAHPRIYFGHTNLNGPIRVFANFINMHEFADIQQHCRSQPGVEKIEPHILLREPGRKCPLTSIDLKILRCLLHNACMRIGEIAQQTHLTTRRIRSALKKLLHPTGTLPPRHYHIELPRNLERISSCYYAYTTFHINSATTNVASSVFKIHFNDAATTRFEIAQWLHTHYPTEYWYSYASASAPLSFHLLTFEHINTLEPVLDHLKRHPHITHVEALLPLQRKPFSPPYPLTQLNQQTKQPQPQ